MISDEELNDWEKEAIDMWQVIADDQMMPMPRKIYALCKTLRAERKAREKLQEACVEIEEHKDQTMFGTPKRFEPNEAYMEGVNRGFLKTAGIAKQALTEAEEILKGSGE